VTQVKLSHFIEVSLGKSTAQFIELKAGVVSISDCYAIFFTSPEKARWAIIEVELASHPVYEHVIP